jgi:N-acetylglucosamine kinase-like BadF-type ATPase
VSASRRFWISIDGGGTKTEICIGDKEKIIYDKCFDSSNYKSSDRETVSHIFSQAFEDIFRELHFQPEDVVGLVMAVSGCDTDKDREVYENILEDLGFQKEQYLVCNDSEVIYRSLSEADGICLVAGTGSIATAYLDGKLCYRVGGWNAPLSDLGSGYWIGAEVLKKYLMWLDGVETEEYPIFGKLLEELSGVGDFGAIAGDIGTWSFTRIASISRLVFEYAGKGDPLCRNVIYEAKEWLVRQAYTLYLKMASDISSGPGIVNVVLVGGLFRHEHFRKAVEESLTRLVGNAEKKHFREGEKTEETEETGSGRLRFICPVNSPAVDGMQYCKRVFKM